MDYLIDYRICRYLRNHPGGSNVATLTRAFHLSDTELIDALERLTAAGQIQPRTRDVPAVSSSEPSPA